MGLKDRRLVLLKMSAIDMPFGPEGRVTFTSKDDTVALVDKMGGPRTVCAMGLNL